MTTILIVEDEDRLREILRDYFEEEGYQVIEAANGREAIEKFEKNKISLILLDVMMPELDGMTVCKKIRRTSDVPIIIITAKSEDEDKILGFELGADEYVTKPFSPKVLVARTKALLKRMNQVVIKEENVMIAGVITINRLSYEVKVADQEVPTLSPKVYELLIYLMTHRNKVLSREAILSGVWGSDYFGDLRTIDTHIKKLRVKLGKGSKYIKTIIRVGYMFEVK
jgi:DNA-binding response OmpR family regulator